MTDNEKKVNISSNNNHLDLSTLNEMQRYVTQQHGTEPPFSGKLLHNRQTGIYHCLCCSAPYFIQIQNLMQDVAGRVFTNPLIVMQYAILMIFLII